MNRLFTFSSILLLCIAMLSACAPKSDAAVKRPNTLTRTRDGETFSTAPATIPAGARMHDASLSGSTWSVTSGLHRIVVAGNQVNYIYTGTGKPAHDEAATLQWHVIPGRTYEFSAWVDPRALLRRGEFDLLVNHADGKSTYALIFRRAGSPGRFATPAWTCPSGVTRVQLVMQIARSAVAKGRPLVFAKPMISDIQLHSNSALVQ